MSPPALFKVSNPSEDYDKVSKLILEALRVIRSDDFSPYFNLFTDDAVWMMPSNFKDVGKEEAKTFYRFTKKFRFDQETAIEELINYLVADDTARPWQRVRSGSQRGF